MTIHAQSLYTGAASSLPFRSNRAAVGHSSAKSTSQSGTSHQTQATASRSDTTCWELNDEHKAAKSAWEAAERQKSIIQRILADRPSLANVEKYSKRSRKARDAGLRYYRQRWPNASSIKPDMSFDEARKKYLAVLQRIKTARAKGHSHKMPELAELMSNAERQFVAARLDPANEEAVKQWRSLRNEKKDRLTAQKATQQSEPSDGSMRPTSSKPSTPHAHVALGASSRDPSFHDSALPSGGEASSPGSPTLATLLDDSAAPDLTWLHDN